jgi:histidine triad (HIT) family protein
MENCVFCQIISGSIPCHKVYEDDNTIAFLNIHPPIEGHVLVVPKIHSEAVWDAEDADYASLFQAVKLVGRRIGIVYQPKRVGVQIEGLEVPHTHVKVFPFNSSQEFRQAEDSSSEPDHTKLAEVAQKLKF